MAQPEQRKKQGDGTGKIQDNAEDKVLDRLVEILNHEGPEEAFRWWSSGLSGTQKATTARGLMEALFDLLRNGKLRLGYFIQARDDFTVIVQDTMGGKRIIQVSPEIHKELIKAKTAQGVILGESPSPLGGGVAVIGLLDMEETAPLAIVKEVINSHVIVEQNGTEVSFTKPKELEVAPGDRVALSPPTGYVTEVYPQPKMAHEFSGELLEPVWFSDLAGINNIVAYLTERVVDRVSHAAHFSRYSTKRVRVAAPKGVVLAGKPGLGKTQLAKAIHFEVARAMGIPQEESKHSVQISRGPQFENMWFGESARLVREFYAQARERGEKFGFATVILDDFDAISRSRHNVQSSGGRATESLVTALLAEMDGLVENYKVITIATTNRFELIDDAFLRPGRLDERVPVVELGEEAQRAIFSLYLEDALVDKDPEEMAGSLAKWSVDTYKTVVTGAIIEYAVQDALGRAATRALRKDKADRASESDIRKAITRQISTMKNTGLEQA